MTTFYTSEVVADAIGRDPVAAVQPGGSRRRGAGVLLVLMVLALALAVPVQAAYFSNQNQYLLPVVGPTIERLQADWLLTTVDPYPVFTAVSTALFAVGGSAAFVAGALAAAMVGWFALYLLSRDLIGGASRAAAALATVLVMAAQFLPLMPNVFGGLGGQYILEQPAYYQPASAGVLVLLGAVLALRARIRPGAASRGTAIGAALATAAGCALHPTYLLVSALLLLAAMLVDLATGRRSVRLLAGYAGIVLGLAVVSIAANPAIVGLAGGDPAVVSRFAFERIPHHTLISQWGVWDLRYVAVVAIAVLLWRRASSWFGRWLLVSLTLAIGLAALADLTRSTTLALAFPARASVILVPLSMAAAAAWAVRWGLGTRVGPVLRAHGTLLAGVLVTAMAFVGAVQTLDLQRNQEPDEVTGLVAAAEPVGVGLVPLDWAEDVRLNAGAALFVDHKSPPYASDDLAEWFRRIDAARAAHADPAQYCELVAAEGISWVVLPGGQAPPACLADWQELGASERFRLLAATP